MKTLESLLAEIAASEQLQTELDAITDKDALEAFLKKHGCSASPEEIAKLAEEQEEGEISDEDAEEAAGGLSIVNFKRMIVQKYIRVPITKAAMLGEPEEKTGTVSQSFGKLPVTQAPTATLQSLASSDTLK